MEDPTGAAGAGPLMTVESRREAARAAYLDSLVAGDPLTGRELGRMFDRSARWGIDRIAEARAAARGNGGVSAHVPVVADGAGVAPAAHGDQVPGAATAEATETASPAPTWKDLVIIVVVALVAGAASYGHLHELALMGGEPTWIAHVFPITVDGLVLAALRHGEAGKWWLRLGLLVSVAANVAAADPTPTGWAVAAWPPLALLGTHKLLHTRS